jgi:hypothetical protein
MEDDNIHLTQNMEYVFTEDKNDAYQDLLHVNCEASQPE